MEMSTKLASMHKAGDEKLDAEHPNFGFLREDALLLLVHVSDDWIVRSIRITHLYGPGFSDLYEQVLGKESRAFWVEVQIKRSSANCFRAGVHCSGVSGDAYETYVARGYDIKRSGVDEPKKAVLGPILRYIQGGRAVANKKSSTGQGEVVIGGASIDGCVFYPRMFALRLRRPFLTLPFRCGNGVVRASGRGGSLLR